MPRVRSPWAQGTARRSTADTSANSAIAIAARSSTAANTRAVSSCAVPTWIACPSPASEPTSSPNTAPITATATATLAPENRYGSDGRQLEPAEQVPAAGAQRAQHPDLVAVDRAQAVERVDGDREEADQGDDHQLGAHSEPEPNHEDRSDHDHRDGLRGDHDRVQGAAQHRGEVERDGHRHADRERECEAEQHLLRRHPGVGEQDVAVLDQGARDLARGGQQVVLHPSEAGGQPPSRPRAAPAARAGGPQSRTKRLTRAPPARAGAGWENSGEVTTSVRGRGPVQVQVLQLFVDRCRGGATSRARGRTRTAPPRCRG